MGTLTFGREEGYSLSSPAVGHIQKLKNIRDRLMGDGKVESMKGDISTQAATIEMIVSAIFSEIPELANDAVKVLNSPPSTWERYLAAHDGKSIYEMEFGELREAVKRDLKSGQNELKVHKEMTHVLAASLYMALIDNK